MGMWPNARDVISTSFQQDGLGSLRPTNAHFCPAVNQTIILQI